MVPIIMMGTPTAIMTDWMTGAIPIPVSGQEGIIVGITTILITTPTMVTTPGAGTMDIPITDILITAGHTVIVVAGDGQGHISAGLPGTAGTVGIHPAGMADGIVTQHQIMDIITTGVGVARIIHTPTDIHIHTTADMAGAVPGDTITTPGTMVAAEGFIQVPDQDHQVEL